MTYKGVSPTGGSSPDSHHHNTPLHPTVYRLPSPWFWEPPAQRG